MAKRFDFPFKIRPTDEDFTRKVQKDFGPGFNKGFVRVNHWGLNMMGHVTEEMMEKYYNQPVEEGDIWVVTLPKCGTTWTQELVWLLASDLDYTAAQQPLGQRWHFLEFSGLHDPDHAERLLTEAKKKASHLPLTMSDMFDIPMVHQRFVKSHLPLSLNPPDLLDKAKVVYVARNPKDMLISYFNHLRLLKLQGFQSDLQTLFEYFIKGEVLETPFFPHVLEAWNLRRHPNMCFLFFEDMKKDLKGCIRKVARFLGKSLTEEQLDKLAHHLHIDNFKNNPAVNLAWLKEHPNLMASEGSFIRKGATGDWVNHFTPEMEERMNAWVKRSLLGTDLSFVERLDMQ